MAVDVERDAHKPLFVLRQHDSAILSCAFYPLPSNKTESKLFISGDTGGTVIVWDLTIRRPLLSFNAMRCAKVQGPVDDALSLSVEGVLAVGFLRTYNANNRSAKLDDHAVARSSTLSEFRTGGGLSLENSTKPSNDLFVATPLATQRPPRGRFRLFHRSSRKDERGEYMETLYLFTQCRNQQLYFWECTLSDKGGWSQSIYRVPRLLYSIAVPQFGFCAVASYCTPNNSTVFAIPQDAEGVISLWRVSIAVRENTNQCIKTLSLSERVSSDLLLSSHKPKTILSIDLISTPTCEVLRESNVEKQKVVQNTLSQSSARSNDMQIPEAIDPAAEVPLRFLSLGNFCSCKGFKGGIIMHIFFRDQDHLSVSFESGHVVLCQYQTSLFKEQQNGEATPNKENVRFEKILAIVRAFPEAAISSLYHVDRLLATSTEGHVHAYALIHPTREMLNEIQDNHVDNTAIQPNDPEQTGPIHLTTLWQNAFRKGIGSAVLQGDFAVLGCWDHTLRVLDARTGEVISSLPFHTETVNTVCIASPMAAMEGSFGFDARHPCCYQYKPRIEANSGNAIAAENTGVYVFASASKDGSIALWRVDFFALLQTRTVENSSFKIDHEVKGGMRVIERM